MASVWDMWIQDYFGAECMSYSSAGVGSSSCAVFSVVSLNSQLLEKTADGTYNVKWEKGTVLFSQFLEKGTQSIRKIVYHMS